MGACGSGTRIWRRCGKRLELGLGFIFFEAEPVKHALRNMASSSCLRARSLMRRSGHPPQPLDPLSLPTHPPQGGEGDAPSLSPINVARKTPQGKLEGHRARLLGLTAALLALTLLAGSPTGADSRADREPAARVRTAALAAEVSAAR